MSTYKTIANNKKAYHEYFIEDTMEAGIELQGSEVKSARLGNVSLKESFAIIRKGELYLLNAHFSPYNKGSFFNPEAKRDRRLLLKKQEILKLKAKVEQKGYTLVATKIYFKDALVKVEIGVAKGKELHDKRQSLKEKQQKREIQRVLKDYNIK